MRTIFEILKEAKDDNLHEFIKYIVDQGKQGTLKASKEDIGHIIPIRILESHTYSLIGEKVNG